MDISEVERKNILEKHEHPWNQRSEVEGMDMMGIHMLEDIGMVEEQLSNERPEVESMDTEEECLSKE
jgi:hypothetical protein